MALRSGGFERGPDRTDRIRSVGRDTGGRAAESLQRGELGIRGIFERKSDEAGLSGLRISRLRGCEVGKAERGERGERKKREVRP